MANNQKLLIKKEEMVLIKNSTTAKDTDVYGNLFDALRTFDKLSEIDFLHNKIFDEKSRVIVLNDKEMLIDNIKEEWHGVGCEDAADKDIHCQLCSRKNKRVFYIRNRNNGKELNVGADCIFKFKGIENINELKRNYAEEQKKKAEDIRRVEFSSLELEDADFVKKSDENFEKFELMLPYNLYDEIKKSLYNLKFMKTNYIKKGGNFEEVTERYRMEKKNNKDLWKKANQFYSRNKNNKLICKRNTANWLKVNNEEIWILVAKNKGIFTSDTLKYVYHIQFVDEH